MRERRAARPLAVPLIALVAAFSWGAIVRVAFADHYHTNCVAHGMVHGTAVDDGSFHSRVETGCGSITRRCEIYEGSNYIGGITVASAGATCNAWSKSYSGSLLECGSKAHLYASGLWTDHSHRAHNWCL